MYVSKSICVVPAEARRVHWIPCKWNSRCLLASMWVLGAKPGSSARAISTLNFGATHLSSPYVYISLLADGPWGGFHVWSLWVMLQWTWVCTYCFKLGIARLYCCFTFHCFEEPWVSIVTLLFWVPTSKNLHYLQVSHLILMHLKFEIY